MRTRANNLKTGMLLLHEAPTDPLKNASLLFLFGGQSSVETMLRIKESVERHEEISLQWHTVVDRLDIGDVATHLDINNHRSFEVEEFQHTTSQELDALLHPLLTQMQAFKQPTMPRPENAVGGIAGGVNFLNREREVEELQQRIKEHRSLQLIAPRRTGKSSLLRHLQTTMDAEADLVYVDLQSDDSVDAAVARICATLRGERFIKVFRSLRREKDKGWREFLRETVADFCAKEKEGPKALLLDELVFLFLNLKSAKDEDWDTILDFLQGLSDACRHPNLALWIAGSISFDAHIERTLGKDRASLPERFQTMERYILKPIDDRSRRLELQRVFLGQGLIINKEDLQWLETHIDFAMPYPAMLWLTELNKDVQAHERKDTDAAFSIEEMQRSLHTFLENTVAFQEIEQNLETRFKQAPNETDRAEKLLDRLILDREVTEGISVKAASNHLGTGDEEKGQQTLTWMLETFPLWLDEERTPSELRCTSRLFRSWWTQQREDA